MPLLKELHRKMLGVYYIEERLKILHPPGESFVPRLDAGP